MKAPWAGLWLASCVLNFGAFILQAKLDIRGGAIINLCVSSFCAFMFARNIR